MKTTILSNRNFSGKLLLIGEHSIIEGSKALVIPYPDVSAILEFKKKPLEGDDLISNRAMFEFASWLKKNKDPALPELDTARFFIDIEQGLCFRSTIPVGYGMGSSGALCAAVYEEYSGNTSRLPGNPDFENLPVIKKELAAMESWFHGTSSGIDPLCIFYNKPLFVSENDQIITWEIENIGGCGLHTFILDTRLKGNTSDIVTAFRNKLQGQSLRESFTKQYIPLVNEVAERFVNGRPDFDLLVQLSLFQWRIFHDMIPGKFWRVWEFGFDWEYYACKLLGSGGGGYILGFTQDFEYARRCLLDRFDLEPVEIKIW